MFLEYLNNPQATTDSFTPEGWFKTGDRVRLEADGYITFADRDKDMLKVGGENVAASEIEQIIVKVPGVYEVAVVAQKHKMLDEVPYAFVIPAPGTGEADKAALPERILAECKAKLADFKVPRSVQVVDEMPPHHPRKDQQIGAAQDASRRRVATAPSARACHGSAGSR